jgi:CHASE2 domain-containing sensor protein
MNLFNRLPGFVREPPGRERKVLRSLPPLFLFGTLALGLLSLIARYFPWSGSATEIATRITTIDIYVISLVLLLWNVLITVAIAAFIIMIMKGPAYVADAYPLVETDDPKPPRSGNS